MSKSATIGGLFNKPGTPPSDTFKLYIYFIPALLTGSYVILKALENIYVPQGMAYAVILVIGIVIMIITKRFRPRSSIEVEAVLFLICITSLVLLATQIFYICKLFNISIETLYPNEIVSFFDTIIFKILDHIFYLVFTTLVSAIIFKLFPHLNIEKKSLVIALALALSPAVYIIIELNNPKIIEIISYLVIGYPLATYKKLLIPQSRNRV